jgi:hypothetical protein
MKISSPSTFDLTRRRLLQGNTVGGAAAHLGLSCASNARAVGCSAAVTGSFHPYAFSGTDFTLAIAESSVRHTGIARIATTVNDCHAEAPERLLHIRRTHCAEVLPRSTRPGFAGCAGQPWRRRRTRCGTTTGTQRTSAVPPWLIQIRVRREAWRTAEAEAYPSAVWPA